MVRADRYKNAAIGAIIIALVLLFGTCSFREIAKDVTPKSGS